MPRTKRYLIANEVLNAVTHGIGICLGVAGLIVLILKAQETGSTVELVSYIVYGATLILLYLSSTLYHSLSFTPAKKVFRVFDHSSIFLLIAGTYTPLCLVTIGSNLGKILAGIVWFIAVVGILYKCFSIEKFPKLSVILYIGMGWLCLFAVRPLYLGLGPAGFGLLLAGGLSFTIGTIFYNLKTVKYMHVLWHLFVLAGTAFMYFSILFYV